MKGEQNRYLAGIWAVGFKYAGTTDRIAYEIKDDTVIPVLLWFGTHERDLV